MRLLPLLACLVACAGIARAQDAARPATPPDLPPGAYAHWHSGKVIKKGAELTLVDLAGSNHFASTLPAFTLAPDGGIVVDGTQASDLRVPTKQPIGKRFTLGADIRFDADGPEHQTVAYLFRFAEFRYRKSKGELSFNVWQSAADGTPAEVVTTVRLPLPPGKWARVRGVIDDTVARLEIDGVKAEAKLPGSWELLPPTSTLIIGKGGMDRVFKGRFDHLYLALAP